MIFHNFVKGFAMSVLDCIAQCLWKYRSNQKKDMYSLFWTCVGIILNIFLAALGLLEAFLWIVCVVFFDWNGRFLFYIFPLFPGTIIYDVNSFQNFPFQDLDWTFTACFSVFSPKIVTFEIFYFCLRTGHIWCFFFWFSCFRNPIRDHILYIHGLNYS